jgi:radical SAM superfamily enzyme
MKLAIPIDLIFCRNEIPFPCDFCEEKDNEDDDGDDENEL